MKPFIFTIFAIFLGGFVANAANINPRMGGGPMYAWLGSQVSISNTTFDLTTNWNPGVAGARGLFTRIFPPKGTTGGTMTCYSLILSETGDPTATYMLLYGGATTTDDDDRPATSTALATSTVVNLAGTTTPKWIAYNFDMTGVTFKTGYTYWVGLINQTATPASNYPTVTSRSANLLTSVKWPSFAVTDGFLGDPAMGTAEAATVCKFPDGSIMGNPYFTSMAHANNTNHRGNGYLFDGDVEALGICAGTGGTITLTSGVYPTYRVYQGATLIQSVLVDKSIVNNGGCAYFDPPITFKGGLRYDVVVVHGSNLSMGPMLWDGSGAPADVSAAKPSGIYYISGTTPGSYATTSQGNFTGFFLQLNNIPSTGLGSGGLWQYQDY